jgi:hypothetical protein
MIGPIAIHAIRLSTPSGRKPISIPRNGWIFLAVIASGEGELVPLPGHALFVLDRSELRGMGSLE